MWKAVVLAAAVATAAGVLPARQGPALPPSPAPIIWSAERALGWTDYAGRPDLDSRAAAITVYRFSYQERCEDETFTFAVASVFQPTQSWVKASALASHQGRARLLVHEQGHFDLSEVSARKLRKALSELEHPCGMTAQARQILVQRHLREDLEEQMKYDAATNYGIDEKQQIRSVVEIARQLAALARFAAVTK